MVTAPVDIDPDEAMRLVGDADVILLDVREDDEWSAGHAPGAVHMRLGDLDPAALGTNRTAVAVCRSGARSRMAAMKLAEAGVSIYNLAGGMKAWDGSGRAVVRDDGTAGIVI